MIGHLRTLLATRAVDSVMLNHVPTKCPVFEELVQSHSAATLSEPHYRLRLVPGAFEKTIEGFSKKHRYNMRRADRQLTERFSGNLALRVFQSDADLAEFVPRAASLTARTYQGAGRGLR